MHYTVFVSFVGECCPRPHLWVETVDAVDKDAAARKVRRIDAGNMPHDYLVAEGAVPGAVLEYRGRA